MVQQRFNRVSMMRGGSNQQRATPRFARLHSKPKKKLERDGDWEAELMRIAEESDKALALPVFKIKED